MRKGWGRIKWHLAAPPRTTHSLKKKKDGGDDGSVISYDHTPRVTYRRVKSEIDLPIDRSWHW